MRIIKRGCFASLLLLIAGFPASRVIADILPAQFQGVIYEVELPPNHSGKLEEKDLVTDDGGTPESLARTLAKVGKTRVLYRMDQPVNVLAETITIGSSEPVIRVGTNSAGQTNSVTTYLNLGSILRMSATRNAAGDAEVKMHLQVSGLGRTGPPVILEHTHPFKVERPALLISDRSFSTDGAGRPAIFVFRYVFGKAGESAGNASAKPQITNGALQAQFQATVYAIHGTAEQAGRLDARALTREAGTPESLLKALTAFGKAEVLFKLDQELNVLSGTAQFSTNVPVKNASRVGANGEDVYAVTYRMMGLNARFPAAATGETNGSPAPEFNMMLGVSSMSDSEVELVRGEKMAAFQTLQVIHRETLDFGRPEVMVFGRLTSQSANATPELHVIRYEFKPPTAK